MLRIEEVAADISGLATAGRLVPFTGAGLSQSLCRGWSDFLNALNAELGLDPIPDNQSPDRLYRIADKAAFLLRLLPDQKRKSHILNALSDTPRKDIISGFPEQTRVLAKAFWPLVITTNYDDLFVSRLVDDVTLRVLGRNPNDCEMVIRALDTNQPRIIWAIQGFVAGTALISEQVSRFECKHSTLLDEIVIGHQQYQVAIHATPNFRRAFAEVYRRRSLLFIGSGLAEAYFVNLFSEIILNYGPGPFPHFALFSQFEIDSGSIDPEFLEMRLGITPVVYGATYSDLPSSLEKLAPDILSRDRPLHTRTTRLSSISYALPRAGSPEQVEVSIRFGQLPKPAEGSCVVLSAGRTGASGAYGVDQGAMIDSFLGTHYGVTETVNRHGQGWRGLSDRLFRFSIDESLPIFAVAARDEGRGSADRRSLAAITEATEGALLKIEELSEFDTIIMGVISAGRGSPIHPIFAFIAQLSGIRRFLKTANVAPRAIQFLEVRIVDPRIIGAISSDRLPVRQLLSSDTVRVQVRIADNAGRWESYPRNVQSGGSVRDALKLYHLKEEEFIVEAFPLPFADFPNVLDAPVFPTMSIEVRPRGS